MASSGVLLLCSSVLCISNYCWNKHNLTLLYYLVWHSVFVSIRTWCHSSPPALRKNNDDMSRTDQTSLGFWVFLSCRSSENKNTKYIAVNEEQRWNWSELDWNHPHNTPPPSPPTPICISIPLPAQSSQPEHNITVPVASFKIKVPMTAAAAMRCFWVRQKHQPLPWIIPTFKCVSLQ